MRNYEGTLEIDGAEFYAWVMSKYNFTGVDIIDSEFLQDGYNVKLYITWHDSCNHSEMSTLDIKMADFWIWLLSYIPISEDEIIFNLPVWDKENQILSVKYAGSGSGRFEGIYKMYDESCEVCKDNGLTPYTRRNYEARYY